MNTPAVSVIMNCLNCAKDLPEALASLKNQTFQDFEVIFWDNGSTDGSAELAKNFGSQLRYFLAAQTSPLGAARNLAISHAQGKYIAFLDCDDLWRPEKLALQVQALEKNPEVGLICTDTEIYDGRRVLGSMFAAGRPARGHVFAELMTRQWISMSSAVIRMAALRSLDSGQNWFDESLELCEEADVFYRIAHEWQLDYIDQPLTVWRVHGGNATFKNFDKFADETLAILDKQRRLYPDYDQRYGEVAEMLTARAAFQKGVALWRSGKNQEARQKIGPYVDRSVKYRLFWLASFLPGSLFDRVSKLYFALPARIRR